MADAHPLPELFSPSSLLTFRKCPAEWRNKYLPRVKTPGTVATVKGNIVHEALERLWLEAPAERTLSTALGLLGEVWKEWVNTADMWWALLSDPLFQPTGDDFATAHNIATTHSTDADVRDALAEVLAARQHHCATGLSEPLDRFDPIPGKKAPTLCDLATLADDCITLMRNYYTLEDPQRGAHELRLPFREPFPVSERAVEAVLDGVRFGGIMDRIEVHTTPSGPTLTITDYKTGAQKTAFSFIDKLTGQRVDVDPLASYWWQQKFYAVVVQEMYGIPVTKLRLVFPSGVGGGAENPTGRVHESHVSQAELEAHRADILATHARIVDCWQAGVWPEEPQRLCGWCYFRNECAGFGARAA